MFFPKRKKIVKVCPVCGREFVGDPQAQTCSNACRQALYRQRKVSKIVVEKIRRRS